MIVFGVADRDDVQRRQFERLQGRGQSGRLVDAGGQAHHRALVEDDLPLEAELLDRIEHLGLIRLPCRHDGSPHGEGRHFATAQRGDEFGRRRRRERPLFGGRREIEERAILGDDGVELSEMRKCVLQVGKFSPGDEQYLATRGFQAQQCGHRRLADLAVLRDRPVVVESKSRYQHEGLLTG